MKSKRKKRKTQWHRQNGQTGSERRGEDRLIWTVMLHAMSMMHADIPSSGRLLVQSAGPVLPAFRTRNRSLRWARAQTSTTTAWGPRCRVPVHQGFNRALNQDPNPGLFLSPTPQQRNKNSPQENQFVHLFLRTGSDERRTLTEKRKTEKCRAGSTFSGCTSLERYPHFSTSHKGPDWQSCSSTLNPNLTELHRSFRKSRFQGMESGLFLRS